MKLNIAIGIAEVNSTEEVVSFLKYKGENTNPKKIDIIKIHMFSLFFTAIFPRFFFHSQHHQPLKHLQMRLRNRSTSSHFLHPDFQFGFPKHYQLSPLLDVPLGHLTYLGLPLCHLTYIDCRDPQMLFLFPLMHTPAPDASHFGRNYKKRRLPYSMSAMPKSCSQGTEQYAYLQYYQRYLPTSTQKEPIEAPLLLQLFLQRQPPVQQRLRLRIPAQEEEILFRPNLDPTVPNLCQGNTQR